MNIDRQRKIAEAMQIIHDPFARLIGVLRGIENACSKEAVSMREFRDLTDHPDLSDCTILVGGVATPFAKLSRRDIQKLCKQSLRRCVNVESLPESFPPKKAVRTWNQLVSRHKWSTLSKKEYPMVRKTLAGIYNKQVQRAWLRRQVNVAPLIKGVKDRLNCYLPWIKVYAEAGFYIGQTYLAHYWLNMKEFKGKAPAVFQKLIRQIRKFRKFGTSAKLIASVTRGVTDIIVHGRKPGTTRGE